MPITVEQAFDLEATSTSTELNFIIRGTDAELEALQSLWGQSPATHGVLVRDTASVKPLGPSLWSGTVNYKPWERVQTNESSFTFDTTGGTQHITHAINHVASFAPSGQTAPNHHGLIGLAGDTIEGVDITVPVYTFTEMHYFTDAQVTFAYRSTLGVLTGKVNNAAWKGLAAGECLFLGASGSKRGSENWEINFRFASSSNQTNIVIADTGITIASKKGWEYFWIEYEQAEDATAKRMTRRAIAAHVEQVYPYGDFGGLGIGT